MLSGGLRVAMVGVSRLDGKALAGTSPARATGLGQRRRLTVKKVMGVASGGAHHVFLSLPGGFVTNSLYSVGLCRFDNTLFAIASRAFAQCSTSLADATGLFASTWKSSGMQSCGYSVWKGQSWSKVCSDTSG